MVFSRAELTNAIRFVSREADRVEIFYDPEGPFARIVVSTGELEAVSESDLAAICMTVRDFVPGHISVEVVTTTAPVILGKTVATLLA